MTTIDFTDFEMWNALQDKGYNIKIIAEDNTQRVQFTGKFALAPYMHPRSYSLEYTTKEIVRDMLPELLHWSGLRPKVVLDYR